MVIVVREGSGGEGNGKVGGTLKYAGTKVRTNIGCFAAV